MQKILWVIVIQLTIISTGFSQNHEVEVVITRTDGTEQNSSIDIKEFEKSGIIRIQGLSGELERLIPQETEKVFLKKEKRTIRSGFVNYFDKNLEPRKKWVFLEVLIDGEVDLFRSYTKEFENVLSYQGTFKALQQYYVNEVLNDDYQGAFYLAFQNCERDLDIYSTKFTERDFIDIVYEYNVCASPDFMYKEVLIVRKDGTELNSSLDIKLYEEKNLVRVKESSGTFYTLNPDEIEKISFINKQRELRPGWVEYQDRNSELKKEWHFLDLLVDGDVSLYRSYSEKFEFVLGYDGTFKALQEYYVDQFLNKDYQGVFYLAFKKCEKNLDIYGISFSEKSFRSAVNKYNSCVSPDYEIQRKEVVLTEESEIEFQIGNSKADLNILENDKRYERSSERYFQLTFKRSFNNRRFYFASGFSRYRYVWKEIYSNRIEGFTEVRIPVNIEARTDVDILDLRAHTGFNITGMFTNIDTNGYVSYNLGGSASLNLFDELNFGIIFNGVLRHRALKNRENNSDYEVQNEFTFGLLIRTKLKN